MKKLLFFTLTSVLMLFALVGCFGENHEYSGPCDSSCNTCNLVTREPQAEHSYSNCDDTECDVCGETRERGEHFYKSDCDPNCEVCGKLREVDADAHYYDSPCDTDCNFCGAQRTASEHIYTTDCDPDCNFCGAQRATAHTYSNACDKDCNACGAVRIPSSHIYSNACDASCDVCGALRTVSNHVYSAICDNDCNVCGSIRSAQPHIYDHACDATCNFCGAQRTVADHVYDNSCDTTCNVCGNTRENTHAFGSWSTKTAATCDTPEILSRSCSVCMAEETKEVGAPLGHDFTNNCDIACNRPKCSYVREITHAFGEWKTKIDATCTTTEIEHRLCEICQHEETRTGDVGPKGHAFDDACAILCNVPGCDFIRKAPHQYDGIEDLECNLCHNSRDCTGHRPHEKDCTKCAVCGDTVEGWEHSYGDYVTLTPATCTEPEYLHKVCSVCAKGSETIAGSPALDHKWTNACDTQCDREGCDFTRTITHAYEWETKTSPSCEADEVQQETCSVCGAKGQEKTIPNTKLPHEYENNCTTKCSLCEKNTRTEAELPHDFEDPAHSVACRGCDFVRACLGHVAKDGDCMTCRYCNATIEGGAHAYDNACDTECNVCHNTRTVAPHSHGGIDCTKCQYCGADTGIEHEALETDCTVCKNCNVGTGKTHTPYPNNCLQCSVCKKAIATGHTPSAQDCTKCEHCHVKIDGNQHEDKDNDYKCDHCQTPMLPDDDDNWFPWAPLS